MIRDEEDCSHEFESYGSEIDKSTRVPLFIMFPFDPPTTFTYISMI